MKAKIAAFSGYHFRFILVPLFVFVFSVASFGTGSEGVLMAAPLDKVPPSARCPVCGMFVAKYDVWITQVKLDNDDLLNFDGVKDMMAFTFSPVSYGQAPERKAAEIWVKDYYSLKWIDGRKAFYVKGSDVHGPMGHELVPFSTLAAAESFKADHKGTKILAYGDITADLIETMRSGHKMKK